MKKIMILGAGVYQVPLIKKAKEMGLETIVVSYEGNYPGFEYADKILNEDTTNAAPIVAYAKKEGIDGIATTGTDVALITIGTVCDELNLKGLSREAAIKAGNKNEMKKAFMDFGVRTARFYEISTTQEAAEAFDKLEKPVIVKAVDTSGSRGIRRVDSVEELESAFNYALDASRLDYCIIEEFIEGEEFGAQAFVLDGKVQFVMPHGDYVFQGDTGVPIGHFVPYEMSKEMDNDLIEQLQASVDALGVDNCAINADFILGKGKIYVLEIGARAGATCLPEQVDCMFGVDYYEQIIRTAIDDNPDFSDFSGNKACACHLLSSEKEGILKEIIYKNIESSDLLDVSFDVKKGDHVPAFRIGPHRLGQVITTGKTLEAATELMFDVMKGIRFVLDEK